MRTRSKFIGGAALLLLGVLFTRAALVRRTVESLPSATLLSVDEQAANRLGAAIQIPTISLGSAGSSTVAFENLRTFLETTFPRTHATLSREDIEGHSLLYTWKGTDPQKKPILIMAHQDVVPVAPGTDSEWTHAPFSGAIADGFVWGRGTLDVKSGMMAILEATEALISSGFIPERTILFAFGHDEETGGHGNHEIAELLEERRTRLEWVIDEGSSVIEGLVPGLKEPAAVIGIAEKGYISAELVVRGEGGHSSMPPKRTAIGILADAITRLEAHPFPSQRKYAGAFFHELTPGMPFPMRIVFANLWLFGPVIEPFLSRTRAMNAALRTTTAVTVFHAGIKDNVLPQEAKAIVNFRIIPGETIESTLEYARKIIGDPTIQVGRVTEGSIANQPSPVSDTNSEAYKMIRTTIRQVAGRGDMLVAPYLVLGATDSRHFVSLADGGVFRFLMTRTTPDDLPRIHGTNERISIEVYRDMIRFYGQLIRNAQR